MTWKSNKISFHVVSYTKMIKTVLLKNVTMPRYYLLGRIYCWNWDRPHSMCIITRLQFSFQLGSVAFALVSTIFGLDRQQAGTYRRFGSVSDPCFTYRISWLYGVQWIRQDSVYLDRGKFLIAQSAWIRVQSK